MLTLGAASPARAASSSMVFHSPHASQRPAQRAETAPQAVQAQAARGLGKGQCSGECG